MTEFAAGYRFTRRASMGSRRLIGGVSLNDVYGLDIGISITPANVHIPVNQAGVSDLTNAKSDIYILVGNVIDTTNWTITVDSVSTCTAQINGGTEVQILTIAADSCYAVIKAVKTGFSDLTFTVRGYKVKDATAVNWAYGAGGGSIIQTGGNTAAGSQSLAGGVGGHAAGDGSIAWGISVIAAGQYSYAFGSYVEVAAGGVFGFATGKYTQVGAVAFAAFAGGIGNIAGYNLAHGAGSFAFGYGSGAATDGVKAYGRGSKAHGIGCVAGDSANIDHATIGRAAQAEGYYTLAKQAGSHAEGFGQVANKNQALGVGAHVEGGYNDIGFSDFNYHNIAYGKGSHAEGIGTIAGTAGFENNALVGAGAHATGINTEAKAHGSSTFGISSLSKVVASRSLGSGSLRDVIPDSDVGINGRADGRGSQQMSEYVAIGKVTGTGLTEIYICGAAIAIPIAQGEVISVTATFVANAKDESDVGATDSFCEVVHGLFQNIGGTTTRNGALTSISKIIGAGQLADGAVDLQADNANDNITIHVNNGASMAGLEAVYWTVYLQTVNMAVAQ